MAPASVLLPGWNLPDRSLQPGLLCGIIITTVAASLAVAVRAWVRFKIVRGASWDDYLILIAMCLSLFGAACTLTMTYLGLGRHVHYAAQEHGQHGMRVQLELGLAAQIIYIYAIGFVKLSIGVALLRFTVYTLYRYVILTFMGLVGLYTVVTTGWLLQQCQPVARTLDGVVAGSCYAFYMTRIIIFTISGCNILTDFAFAALPFPLLWNLNISIRTKASLLACLSLGVFAALISIVKFGQMATYYGIAKAWVHPAGLDFEGYTDFSWVNTKLQKWMTVEANVSITAASIPAMRPLLRTYCRNTSKLTGLPGSNSKSPNLQYTPSRRQNTNDWNTIGSIISGSKSIDNDPYTVNCTGKRDEKDEGLIAVKNGEIMVTTVVEITYEDNRSIQSRLGEL
ncbi:hypothetical protein GLAREA_00503 [Glarea lozoyensis ATCC 20868]|uniref:Rhodopsin domain-containing protein n=1 Tax=Glarea lozoyensis (strain ATCC 20868 / MF5171) TaxID=1116229 RepID=S3DSE6_GLAL2|nr:uncharacterized protein GLAREA_00503 [Glarea lozoyensis ATCC 20868]EPE29343.1 hypothetical protein GLAREA_00503 [Glarea lozoyensis ATCC 20868]